MYIVEEFNRSNHFTAHATKLLKSKGKEVSENKKQCAAVVCSVLHETLLGKDSYMDIDENCNAIVNNIMLGGSFMNSYTVVALKKVKQLLDHQKLDFSQVSNAGMQTLVERAKELTCEIADKYSFDDNTLARIEDAYDHVTELYLKTGNKEEVAKECYNTMCMNSDDHDVYRFGKAYLENYLRGNQDMFWILKVCELKSGIEDQKNIITDVLEAADEKLGDEAIQDTVIADMKSDILAPRRTTKVYKWSAW